MSGPSKNVERPIPDFGRQEEPVREGAVSEKPDSTPTPASSYTPSSFDDLFETGIRVYGPRIQEILKAVGLEDEYLYSEDTVRMLYPIIQISPIAVQKTSYGDVTGGLRQIVKTRRDVPKNILMQMLGCRDDESVMSEMDDTEIQEFLNQITPFSRKSYELRDTNVKVGMRTLGLGIDPQFRPLFAATIEAIEEKSAEIPEEIIKIGNREEALEYVIPLPILTGTTKKYSQPLNEIPLLVRSFSDLINDYKSKWSIG